MGVPKVPEIVLVTMFVWPSMTAIETFETLPE
jgi:hypothetical protein